MSFENYNYIPRLIVVLLLFALVIVFVVVMAIKSVKPITNKTDSMYDGRFMNNEIQSMLGQFDMGSIFPGSDSYGSDMMKDKGHESMYDSPFVVNSMPSQFDMGMYPPNSDMLVDDSEMYRNSVLYGGPSSSKVSNLDIAIDSNIIDKYTHLDGGYNKDNSNMGTGSYVSENAGTYLENSSLAEGLSSHDDAKPTTPYSNDSVYGGGPSRYPPNQILNINKTIRENLSKKNTDPMYQNDRIIKGDYEGVDTFIYPPDMSEHIPVFSEKNPGIYIPNSKLM